MPEGHSIHRLARQFSDVFVGEKLVVSSPQGKFAPGAAVLDGHVLESAAAHGKHLFLTFRHGMVLHVHLGLYGAWSFGGDSTFTGASSIGAPRRVGERETFDAGADAGYDGPPAPVGAVRVRLVSGHGWADLRGATTCAALTGSEVQAVLDRLGPDPLHNLPGDRAEFVARLRRRRTAVGQLLMDQSVLAGVGNIYRAEALFRQRVDPWMPGAGVPADTAAALWDDTVLLMNDGVRHGRIITTPAEFWDIGGNDDGLLPGDGTAHFVYKRHGQPCRVCGSSIGIAEMAARKLYWCPGCQAAG
ncbi:DNA-formamidopyrimidine glycosylase family protein [Pseudarthrobacter sp. J75]|uniref:Fpg/Nei family DNA glycosylase n=1 Tax=unclassified Pseudarthrobacter TaxID=2647000 RepID=UPI002E814BD4|nr:MULTISPECIES: DNA-formamidopyrimidine glycosylase family protein [unclassified Pseudarthrobacter]MEE2522956.1 DNA-formamidopyrimidine glycosylase family protein [Pseudarthrobacter sp. J47]MEE2529450.1 DNA-formamidopyrimidine glycosylase family protein [Pseudarthrobacter sp. J75]MEE2568632.1 DNA-formamidopyrimidine glycosylase family protein [Pseudarthrobacter sp. J64]